MRYSDFNKCHPNSFNDFIFGTSSEIGKEFEKFFGGLFEQTNENNSDFLPKLDLQESKTSIDVTVELPGVDEKDINISLKDKILTIKGEKKSPHDDQDLNSERKYGSFHRSIKLSSEIEEDNVIANFKNGVLVIKLPKLKNEAEEPKIITVNAS